MAHTKFRITNIFWAGGIVAAVVVAILGHRFVTFYGDYRVQEEISDQIDRGAVLLSADNLPSPESFHPVRVLPRQRSISEFPVVSADEADKVFDNDELVLGVEINGESRAYSLNSLNGPSREIFNDTLGGTPIMATW